MRNLSWSAFVTVHWFATGTFIMADSKDPVTSRLYYWFINMDNK